MFPTTVDRVPAQTVRSVNEQIRLQTQKNIARFRGASQAAISKRLAELDAEWDIERRLETNASVAILVGLTLGATVDRRFYLLPAAVAGFLLQHALHGWCPPLPVFRRFGVRTASEIDYERYALKALRGDFDNVKQEREYGNIAAVALQAATS